MTNTVLAQARDVIGTPLDIIDGNFCEINQRLRLYQRS